jgi:predicted transcriptional regulator
MATTIQISDELKSELSSKKLYQKETYEEVIWAILQDIKDLDEQTQREIAAARGEIKSGEFYDLSQARSKLK